MGRKIPMWQCIIAILAMVVFLFWNVMKDEGGEAHGGLIMAALVAGIIGAANGWKWSYMEQGILAAINRSMQAMLILAVVGAMIGTWKAGGVIPSMMYYGIKIISPKIFLFTACLLCAVISLATGSSWSTAGSVSEPHWDFRITWQPVRLYPARTSATRCLRCLTRLTWHRPSRGPTCSTTSNIWSTR